MRKSILIALLLAVLLLLSSCYSFTTYIDEDKLCYFTPGQNGDSSIQMADGTINSNGTTESGDRYFSYYTKSQDMYDMFEFGLISKADKKEWKNEPQVEFYFGDYKDNQWVLIGKWNSDTYEIFNEEYAPLVFLKNSKRNVEPHESGVLVKESDNKYTDNTISGRIYIKDCNQDCMIVFTTESGERIVSFFRLEK